jgi:hypothetical protein
MDLSINESDVSKYSEDKELFSREQCSKENTMILLKDLSIDKELFSREQCSNENTMILSKQVRY